MPSSPIPVLPAPCAELTGYIGKHPNTPIVELIEPYRKYEARLRQLYAQEPDHDALKDPYVNVLPVYANGTCQVEVRARDSNLEPKAEQEKYIMPLPKDLRRPSGSPATVPSFKDFQRNFNVFSESSLVDLKWNNVVAAGSSVVNCLLPVPKEFNGTKRSLREFYHEKFCPASDVDLFLYGLTEEEAIAKIKEIETSIRDSILTETTTVRTKHTITICSQYPTRHVQIVLRIYKSVSEILTGFDIDCSGAAYDGKQVYCTPRALQSYITQINHIDLSRRSPSYENRLSKYSHRGFEIYFPDLKRSRIDPTIFERSFQRTIGLARLLVLERLPTAQSRDMYNDKRRKERGRPPIYRHHLNNRQLRGNIKDEHEDEVAEWINEDEISNYHTFTLPYGPRFYAKKIEKLCYTRDLLLNAEWNQPDNREVYLHRHPAFFGRVEDVLHDCCGFCPSPKTEEEKEIAETEEKIYVSGALTFIKDDPGRQQIGSFNPLTSDDWTDMAYIGNTARLFQAIVDKDFTQVQAWLAQEDANPNTRDHTGRAPLHVAAMSSSLDVVRCLVDHGARLVARLADGRTALHLAAERGDLEIVKILMEKSTANEAAEEEKRDQRRNMKAAGREDEKSLEGEESEEQLLDDESYDEDAGDDDDDSGDGEHSMATGSFVKVRKSEEAKDQDEVVPEEKEDDPDFYTIDVIAWDTPCSALHFAIISGHEEVVKLLCQEYGADVLLPVKFLNSDKQPTAALLSLVLALALPPEKASSMAKTLLSLGATSAQADITGVTAFHRYVQRNVESLIQTLWEEDKTGTANAINHMAIPITSGSPVTPLQSAVATGNLGLVLKLLDAGALPHIDFETWLKSAKQSTIASRLRSFEDNQKLFNSTTQQPLILALQSGDPGIALELLRRGADPNCLTINAHSKLQRSWNRWAIAHSALDIVREQLSGLRKYTGETVPEEPMLPPGIDTALQAYKPGTWQRWMVANDIDATKKKHCKAMKTYHQEKVHVETLKGVMEKRAAIDEAIATLEKIEKTMLDKGAKTFVELHPDPKAKAAQPMRNDKLEVIRVPYEFDFTFGLVFDMTEARKAAYIRLFEAAWDGNLDEIKKLTLTSWDAEGTMVPLKVSVTDRGKNTPFSLAFFRGHHTVARAILEICQAQYLPDEEVKARYRMGEDSEDDLDVESEDDERDDAEPKIYREIVDDQFTIENVGQVSMKVMSDVKPQEFMNWSVPEIVNGKMGKMRSLLSAVIAKKDLKDLNFLLDLGEYFSSQKIDPEDAAAGRKFYTFPDVDFEFAVKQGCVDLLPEIIRRTGAGLPLEELVKSTGLEIQEKPRYYQGLTVYGRKRKDWATAGRRVLSKSGGTKISPLLIGAAEGSIESVEWFLSDAPLRHYLDFAKSKAARDDPRLKHLSQSPGGFDRAISTWLGDENELVIHTAILGPPTKAAKLVEYLLRTCPSSLNIKSQNGMTPLALASHLGRLDVVKILLDNGADPTTHAADWDNILHQALARDPPAEQLRSFLDLLNLDVRTRLFKERSSLRSTGTTPLHSWLYKVLPMPSGERAKRIERLSEVLNLLLSYSGGAELEMLDGAGDTPLHTMIAKEAPLALLRALLDLNPRLLHRENAVGRTPAELAHDNFVASKVAAPAAPTLQGQPVSGLAARKPDSFIHVAGAGYTASPRNAKERIWDLCRGYAEAEGTSTKRRLVSLHEANDVARRLGETYRRQDVGFRFVEKDQQEAKEKIEDIVAAKTKHAMPYPPWATEEKKKEPVCADCGEVH